MHQALFENLTGHFLDGTPIDGVPAQNRRMMSVMDHLTRMFNTREGGILHLKDYGPPDISEIRRKMPHGIEDLLKALKRTVEKYEPRLQKVKLTLRETDPGNLKLVFILSGELPEVGLVRFQTTFTSMGNASIAPWKKPE
jgi:type VI secretion system protein